MPRTLLDKSGDVNLTFLALIRPRLRLQSESQIARQVCHTVFVPSCFGWSYTASVRLEACVCLLSLMGKGDIAMSDEPHGETDIPRFRVTEESPALSGEPVVDTTMSDREPLPRQVRPVSDPQRKRVREDFEFLKAIGEGSFSTVGLRLEILRFSWNQCVLLLGIRSCREGNRKTLCCKDIDKALYCQGEESEICDDRERSLAEVFASGDRPVVLHLPGQRLSM